MYARVFGPSSCKLCSYIVRMFVFFFFNGKKRLFCFLEQIYCKFLKNMIFDCNITENNQISGPGKSVTFFFVCSPVSRLSPDTLLFCFFSAKKKSYLKISCFCSVSVSRKSRKQILFAVLIHRACRNFSDFSDFSHQVKQWLAAVIRIIVVIIGRILS